MIPSCSPLSLTTRNSLSRISSLSCSSLLLIISTPKNFFKTKHRQDNVCLCANTKAIKKTAKKVLTHARQDLVGENVSALLYFVYLLYTFISVLSTPKKALRHFIHIFKIIFFELRVDFRIIL